MTNLKIEQIYTTKHRLAIELTSKDSPNPYDAYKNFMELENCRWGHTYTMFYPTDPIGTIDFNITALSWLI